jgi:hypothetical protein
MVKKRESKTEEEEGEKRRRKLQLFRVKNVGLRVGIGSNPGRVSNPFKFFFGSLSGLTRFWASPIR